MESKSQREFKAKIIKGEDGKMQLSIDCGSEVIKRPDGSQDVVIHAPSLGLINKFLTNQKEV
jgi:hypothetical protein